MAQRTRRNELKIYLNDEEKNLLDEKVRNSEMVSTTAFIRHLIKYGFVYTVDYEILRDMVEQLRGMAVNINQIAHKVNGTDTVYRSDIENPSVSQPDKRPFVVMFSRQIRILPAPRFGRILDIPDSVQHAHGAEQQLIL